MTAARAIIVVALAACGGKHAATSPPTATPTPAPAAQDPAPQAKAPEPAPAPADDDKCTPDDKSLTLDGAKLEIETCTISERQGSVDTESTKEAHLLVDGKQPYTLGQWEAGYEWGGSWDLEAVLQGRGAGGVAFVSENEASDAGSSTTLHALQHTGAAWNELWREGGTEVKVEIAGDVVTVRTCETDQMTGCDDKKAKHRVARWKWNGTSLEAMQAPAKHKGKKKKHH